MTSAFGQRLSFKFYGQDQGLSNLATERLYQDRSGYLWVGTQNGLFRYDCGVFVGFGEAEGLPGSSIESIVETPEGVLWVATNRGLARRRGNRFQASIAPKASEIRTFRARFGRQRSTVSKQCGRSAGLDGAQFWVDPGLRTSVRSAIGSGIRLDVGKNRVVWYGCGSEVCRVSGVSVTQFGTQLGVPPDRWDALLEDQDGNVWIRSSRYLLRKANGAAGFEPVIPSIPPISDFASLSAGHNGELFVPTDEGVWEFANGRWRAIGRAQGLASDSVSSVLQDREGSIGSDYGAPGWLGGWGETNGSPGQPPKVSAASISGESHVTLTATCGSRRITA